MNRIRTLRILFFLFLPAAFVAGRMSLAQEPDKKAPAETVSAQKYTIMWGESALELSHGGGMWVEELYFPEMKVACALVYEYPPIEERKLGVEVRPRPRLYAYPADGPRNKLIGFRNPKPSPIEKVEVPAALAERIRALAELTKRHEDATWRLGKAISAEKVLKELPKADRAFLGGKSGKNG